jgi:hypothetical protein
LFVFSETICPEGWNLYRDSCVKISEQSLTYDNAKTIGCTEGVLFEDATYGFWSQVCYKKVTSFSEIQTYDFLIRSQKIDLQAALVICGFDYSRTRRQGKTTNNEEKNTASV